MRLSLAATAAALLAVTEARINGISVPSTIKPGDTFDVIIESSNYIQSVYDVAIAVGYAPGNGYPESLGSIANSFYLGPAKSNQLHSFNETITIPSTIPKGKGIVTASLMSLYGAAYSPTLTNYNVSITFGDKTSKTYKSSY
ncbi:hypothetical protein G7Z17_g8950 [Cylindrodendrum hubeiense]|uniref:Secreted protein NIS1 n=1 Tax=Cylindrodendrum hubeiense TaxID=595255 RepID=A0A9P5H0B7_9HYPO|nr:hypothetical protein G7Z17_g8950 [Cylindrodendrum hubeiense]